METPLDQYDPQLTPQSPEGAGPEPAELPTDAPVWPRFMADSTAANRPAANRPAANRPAANRPAANRPAANQPTVTPRIADRPEVLPLNLPRAAAPRRPDGLRPAKGHRAAANRRPAPAPRSQSRPLLLKWLRRAPLVILILLGLGCAGLSWLAVQEILSPGAETHHVALAEKEQEQISSLFLLGGVAVGCVSVSILLAQQLRRAPRR
jgi:hypothetical protein